MTKKHARRGAIRSVLALLLVACLAVPAVRGVFEAAAQAIEGIEVHYFNDDVQDDNIDTNNYNFGPDRYKSASEAVADGKAAKVVEYIATKEGTGDFFESIKVDPALCAAIALDMDERLAFDEKILTDEQDVVIGQRADAAHLHFLKDHAYWERAVKMITERLTSGEISIQEINDYTSSMYQWHNGLEGNKPAVIVRNSHNSGGHFVQFNLGKPGVVRYRLECGYQPVDVDYWPTPDKPPIPDNPEPPTPPDEPELEPKDPDAGPQAQIPEDTPGYDDFGGGQNHDPITEITDEPVSPPSYTPPEPPQPITTEPDVDAPPQTSDGQRDASADTDTGSVIIDTTDGTVETHTDPDTGQSQEYEVVAGDGTDHGDLGEIQQEYHDADTVEPAVEDDGVNEGDLDEEFVE